MKVDRTDFNNSLLDYGFKDYQIKAIQEKMDKHIYPQIKAILMQVEDKGNIADKIESNMGTKKKVIEILQRAGARFDHYEKFSLAVELISNIASPKDIKDYDAEMNTILEQIRKEVLRAKSIHKNNFHNLHEGYAVIEEEMDEFWDEIKVNPNKEAFSLSKIKQEGTQVAAMLVRFLVELC